MPLTLDLTGRAAIVTGGSRGIGSVIARTLARAGASVAVGAHRSPDRADALVEEVVAEGGTAIAFTGDVALPETAERAVAAAVKAFGRLDILVNNAGIWEEAAIDAMTPDALHRTIGTNLLSAFHFARAATPHLKSSGHGRIVNVSSTASLMGEPLHSHYAASKGGLDALTRSLAVELGPHRVTVNSVAPGWTETEMTAEDLQTEFGKRLVASIPLRKIATCDDVAYAVAFLASDWAGHVNGTTIPVEGAYRIRR